VNSLEAETLLALRSSMYTANSLAFLIFGKAKKSQILCVVLQKMAVKKSHFGMCMATKGYFITVRISAAGQRQGYRGVAASPLFWRRPLLCVYNPKV